MNKFSIVLVILIITVGGLWWWHAFAPENDTELTNGADEEEAYSHEDIVVAAPTPHSSVTSPLAVSGEAKGFWYFEADFPVRIYDENGTELGVGIATAQGDWMTEDFVSFTAEVEFGESSTPTGFIVFERDNPSDMPENDDSFSFPIQFASTQDSGEEAAEQTISLYFYNESLDTDAGGNILCSPDAVVPVERTIPGTQSPARDAVQLILAGAITDEEVVAGLSTEYPLSGVGLADIVLSDGVLTIELNDPEFATSGGSCRVTLLRAQLEKTALQFDTVDEVVILPEDTFQP